jgi:hypothetical protein
MKLLSSDDVAASGLLPLSETLACLSAIVPVTTLMKTSNDLYILIPATRQGTDHK